MGRETECVDDTGIWECVEACQKCQAEKKTGGRSSVDLMIWHANEHVAEEEADEA